MSTENVKIVEVNAENWYDCCELEVTAEQENYIESNAISIAQSKFEPTLKPYVIYADEKAVGFPNVQFSSRRTRCLLGI